MGDNLFGLAICIDYEDNATAGLLRTDEAFRRVNDSAEDMVSAMSQKTDAMNELAKTGASYIYSGKEMMNIGGGIINSFVNLGKSVVDTGADFENTRVTLEALYKSKEIAEEKLQWAVDFGANSPFDIADVKGLMVGMKAIGVELDQEVTTVGGHTQELLGYIGDLGALRPDVGLGRIGYAIRNALGGNSRSLKAALDVDIDQILGRKFGAGGAETVAQDIADLVEGLGAEGLMEKLFGTWGQMVSELGDQMERIKLAIADAGAFDGAKAILKQIFEMMNKLTNEEILALGEGLSDIFTSLLKPVGFLVDVFINLVNKVKELIITRPDIVKFAVGFVAIGASLTVVLGALTVLTGMFLVARSMLGHLSMSIIKLAFGSNVASVGMLTLFKSVALLAGKALLMIAIAKVLYNIFKDDIAKVMTSVSEAFKILSYDFNDFSRAVNDLDSRSDIFGKLTLGIMKVITVFKALIESWGDDTLSEDTFLKAEKLGILPIIETLMELKWAVQDVWEGFKVGLESMLRKAVDVGIGIYNAFAKVWGVFKKIRDFIVPTKAEFDDFRNVAERGINVSPLEKFGKVLGVIAGLFVAGKILVPIIKIGGALFKLGKVIFGVLKFAKMFTPVGAIITAIGIAVLLMIKHWDTVKVVFGNVIEWIVVKLTTFKDFVVNIFNNVVDWISKAWNRVSEIISRVVDIIVGILEIAWALISGAIRIYVEIWKGIFRGIIAVFTWIKDKVVAIWTPIGEFFSKIWEGVVTVAETLWNNFLNGLRIIYEGIVTLFTPVVEFFSVIWSNIKAGAEIVWQGILTFIEGVVTGVEIVWNGVVGFFDGIWKGIKDGASIMFEWLSEKFGWVATTIEGISGAMGKIGEGVGKGWEKIKEGGRKIVGKPPQQLATGGYIKGEGIAHLHPNEIVINDTITKRLASFLSREDTGSANNRGSASVVNLSPIVVPPKGETDSLITNNYSSTTPNNSSSTERNSIDNSITVENGAIQITMTDGNSDELDSLVDELFAKIERKRQLKDTMNYKPLPI